VSEIDRGSHQTREYHSKRNLKKIIFGILIAFNISVLVILLSSLCPEEISSPQETPPTPMLTKYISQSPIFINGNSEFYGLNTTTGISNGSGSQTDPFVIKGWEIDASMGEFGIKIIDTDLYFIVEDCYIREGTQAGILLVNVHNGTLTGNNCTWNENGIVLTNSQDNIVFNNSCGGNWAGSAGIMLRDGSHDNKIRNNTCNSNEAYGIWLYQSDGNTIEGNNCSNQGDYGYGIASYGAHDEILLNNTCSNNEYGIMISLSQGFICRGNILFDDGLIVWGTAGGIPEWNSHTIDTSNTVNSRPVLYYKDLDNFSIASGGGELILANCRDAIIENQDYCNGSYGIELGWCHNITLQNNSYRGEKRGGCIIAYSDRCQVIQNNISKNKEGIQLWYSNNNEIKKCNCSDNWHGSGIEISPGDSNKILNNTCLNNSDFGIYLNYGDHNSIKNNNCHRNHRSGVFLSYSNYNNIIENSISYCAYNLDNEGGITLSFSCCCNNFTQNFIYDNEMYGASIVRSDSSDNRFWNNTFISNNGAGSVYDINHIQAYDDGTNNWWNTSGSPHGYGNYWSDLTTPDANFNGVVDWSYNLTGSAGAKDYYPLTTPTMPIPEPAILILAGVMMMIFLMVGRARKKP